MKKKEFSELKLKKASELEKIVGGKKNELVTALFGKSSKETKKDIKKSWKLRLEIARILTLIREKEILERKKI
jgi:ribosomal protein L29